MRIFLTGTAGFIGYHLAARLLKDGHHVTGYDGLTPYYDLRLKQQRHANLSAWPQFTPMVGMLEDSDFLNRAADEAQPEAIIHLAAQAGVRYSIEAPRSYVSSNVEGSLNVLELARRLKPKHLLLASTSSIYGMGLSVPWHETDKADEPVSLYAATKKSMELMAHSYAHLFSIPTTAFRFFTVYGPWGRPDMALFKFCEAIAAKQSISVYGHGRQKRDFTYVDDLVEAIVRLVEKVPEKGGARESGDTLSPIAPYRIVNIGGGQPVDLLAFVEIVEQAMGSKVNRNMLDMQPGDVPVTYASPDLLYRLIGYSPTTSLAEGIKHFVEWFKTDYTRLRQTDL